MDRELVVLGTASQTPTRYRNHNGYLLRWDGHGILFDPGEGTQRQLLLAGHSGADVDRICLTHLHGDHCLGVPGVLARMALDQVAGPVPVHHPSSGAEGHIDVGGRTVTLDEVSVPRPGQRFALVMDTRPCPGALELAAGVDLLVCESTFLEGEADLAHRYGHMTARQAARLAVEAGARTLVLVHFSQRHPDEAVFRAEAEAEARGRVEVVAAGDLDRIRLPPRRPHPVR